MTGLNEVHHEVCRQVRQRHQDRGPRDRRCVERGDGIDRIAPQALELNRFSTRNVLPNEKPKTSARAESTGPIDGRSAKRQMIARSVYPVALAIRTCSSPRVSRSPARVRRANRPIGYAAMTMAGMSRCEKPEANSGEVTGKQRVDEHHVGPGCGHGDVVERPVPAPGNRQPVELGRDHELEQQAPARRSGPKPAGMTRFPRSSRAGVLSSGLPALRAGSR